MLVPTLFIGILLFLILKWYVGRVHKQATFKRLGIPGPKPHFIYGNWMEIMKIGSRLKYMEWQRKYGKTFGFFEGAVPVLATGDLEMIKQILVKEFSSFHSRKERPFSSSCDSIVNTRGDAWKRQRMILSPTFSTRGIKEMSPTVNETITKLIVLLEKRAEEGLPFDIMMDFQGLTLSTIASCGFGLDVDALNNQNDIFLKNCLAVFKFKPSALARLIYVLSFLCPSILPIFKSIFPAQLSRPKDWFFATTKAIIESRREKKCTRKDFIHLMLLAEEHEQPQGLESLEMTTEEDKAGTQDRTAKRDDRFSKGKYMSMEEMQASCMAFLLAGFETTSSTLAFFAYELAVHPKVQDKLLLEVDEHFPKEQLPDYLSVQKLSYMDMVFSETLRLHPPGQMVQTRQCFLDCSIGGFNLKRGTAVQILVDVVHRDPDLWGPDDPDQFVPERFLPERKSQRDTMAWMPFGGGPRNCIGMRFAIMEVKMTVARILKRFRIVRCDETQVPLKISVHGFPRPESGVYIKLVTRKECV